MKKMIMKKNDKRGRKEKVIDMLTMLITILVKYQIFPEVDKISKYYLFNIICFILKYYLFNIIYFVCNS